MADYSGAESIGFLLGGGAKQIKQQSYDEGRLNTARTEEALARAREKQLEAQAKAAQERELEAIGDQLAATGDPNAALMTSILRAGRGNAQQLAGGVLGVQEFGQRQTLADPDAPIGDQFAAGQGVQGKVLPRLAPVGEGNFLDLLDETPELAPTPVGESVITRNIASANLSDERRTNPAAFRSGGNARAGVPAGFERDPTDPTRLRPMAGGPQDPDSPGKIGVRERQVVARVLNAAANNAADLANIVEMPSGASSGVFGSGAFADQGVGILDATISQMKNSLADEEVLNYNTMLGGLTSSMVTLERMGMQGTSGLAEEFGALVFRPNDTLERKMLKLALIRQSTENAVATVLAVNPLPQDSQEFAQNLVEQIQKAVPYTPRDVIELQKRQRTDPTITLRQLISQQHNLQSSQDSTGDEGALEQVLLESGAQQDEQGQIIDERGWIFMRSADGSPAWVSPDMTEFEPIAE